MDGNLAINDSAAEKAATNLTSLLSLADQREITSSSSLNRKDNVLDFTLDNNDKGQTSKFEQPHNWYVSAPKTYALPSAIMPINGLEPTLRAGWRTVNDSKKI